MSEAPPLGAEVEPEANPLSRPLVPFGRRRKELGPEAETSPLEKQKRKKSRHMCGGIFVSRWEKSALAELGRRVPGGMPGAYRQRRWAEGPDGRP